MEGYSNLISEGGVMNSMTIGGDEQFLDGEDLDDSKTRTPDLVRKQLFKTKMCPFHQESKCQKGSGCTFAHSNYELRPLPDLKNTRLCRSVKMGQECIDPLCKYAHARSDLRTTDMRLFKVRLCNFDKKGKCLNGDHCRFAHGSSELRGSSATNGKLKVGGNEGSVETRSSCGGRKTSELDGDNRIFQRANSGNGRGSANYNANKASSVSPLKRNGNDLQRSNNKLIVNGITGEAEEEKNIKNMNKLLPNNNQDVSANSDNLVFFADTGRETPVSFCDFDRLTNGVTAVSQNAGVRTQTMNNNQQSISSRIPISSSYQSNMINYQNCVSVEQQQQTLHNNATAQQQVQQQQALHQQAQQQQVLQQQVMQQQVQQLQLQQQQQQQQQQNAGALRFTNNAEQTSQEMGSYINHYGVPQQNFCYPNVSHMHPTNGSINSGAAINNGTNNNNPANPSNNNNTNNSYIMLETHNQNQPTNFISSHVNVTPSHVLTQNSQLRASAPSYSPQMPLTDFSNQPHSYITLQQPHHTTLENTLTATTIQGGASLPMSSYPKYPENSSQQCNIPSCAIYSINVNNNVNSNTCAGGNGAGLRRSFDDTSVQLQMPSHVDIYSQQQAAVGQAQQHYITAAQPNMQHQMMNQLTSIGGASGAMQNVCANSDINNRGVNVRGGGMQTIGREYMESSPPRYANTGASVPHPHHRMYEISSNRNNMAAPLSTDSWNCMNREVMMGGGTDGKVDMYKQQQGVNIYQTMQPGNTQNSQGAHQQHIHQQSISSQMIRINSVTDYTDGSNIMSIMQQQGANAGLEQGFENINNNEMKISYVSSKISQNNETQQQQLSKHGSITPTGVVYDNSASFASDGAYTSAYSDFMTPGAIPPPICTGRLSGAVYHPPMVTISSYMQQQHVSGAPVLSTQMDNMGSVADAGGITRCFDYGQVQYDNNNINGSLSSDIQQRQLNQSQANENTNSDSTTARTSVPCLQTNSSFLPLNSSSETNSNNNRSNHIFAAEKTEEEIKSMNKYLPMGVGFGNACVNDDNKVSTNLIMNNDENQQQNKRRFGGQPAPCGSSYSLCSSSCVENKETTQHVYTSKPDAGNSIAYVPQSLCNVVPLVAESRGSITELNAASSNSNTNNCNINGRINSSINKRVDVTSNNEENSKVRDNGIKAPLINNTNSATNSCLRDAPEGFNNLDINNSANVYNDNIKLLSCYNNNVYSSCNNQSINTNGEMNCNSSNTNNNNTRTPISQMFAFSSFDLGLNNENKNVQNSEEYRNCVTNSKSVNSNLMKEQNKSS